MKIIGRTEAGARLVEITTEEIIALNAAAQALKSMNLDCVIVSPEVPAELPIQPEKGKIRGSLLIRRAFNKLKTSKTLCGKRLCLCCEKPLPKNAHPSMKTHNGKCKKMYAREYARNHYREKNGIAILEHATVVPQGNPADPGLTNQQRLKLKANRENILKTINERIDARGN